MNSGEAAINALINSDASRDYLVISGKINRDLHYRLSNELDTKARNSSCTLFLTTYGGDPDAAFRIARCLQHYYTSIRIVVTGFCKSAGTLITLVGNEIAIGDLGELGPLDIQVNKGSELLEQSSGLDMNEALQAVTEHIQFTFHNILVKNREAGLSTKMAAELAAKVSTSISAPLLSQLDPLRIGEMQRKTRIAFDYGEKLNGQSKILKDDGLESLVRNYPSHGFVIDRKEARSIFKHVDAPNPSELTFFNFFSNIMTFPEKEKAFVELLCLTTDKQDDISDEK
ncbi:ATP-dependent Clp protease proteolytic subunit [Luteimonas sp. FXH3W]|uniref:ATP-dependent Clp protease proteolytic subunit n=1 Tax=Aquilutibacter rugosus TaxID=3115820 RepID=A0ABU7V3G9_9GAMM